MIAAFIVHRSRLSESRVGVLLRTLMPTKLAMSRCGSGAVHKSDTGESNGLPTKATILNTLSNLPFKLDSSTRYTTVRHGLKTFLLRKKSAIYITTKSRNSKLFKQLKMKYFFSLWIEAMSMRIMVGLPVVKSH